MKIRVGFLIVLLSLTYLTLFTQVEAQARDPTQGNGGNDSANWPSFRFDSEGHGVSNSTAPQTSEIQWRYQLGDKIYTSPAVFDGRVYAAGEKGRFSCLNVSTGVKIWGFDTGAWSSPAVSNNRVYFGSSTDNNVYCLDAFDGKLVWNYATGASIGSSPVISEGKLYIGTYDASGVLCLDAVTGAKLWNSSTAGQVWSSPVVSSGRVYVGDLQGSTVYCFDAELGTRVWDYKTGGMVWSSPTVVESSLSPGVVVERVYVGSADNSTYCLDAGDGTLVWSFETGGYVESSPAYYQGRIYFGSFDKKLYCVDAATGQRLWDYSTGDVIWSTPAIAGGKVIFGSYDASVYCLNAATGAEVWSYKTGDYIFSSPAIAGGRVFIGSADGFLYCFGAGESNNGVWVPTAQGTAVAAAVSIGAAATISVVASAATAASGGSGAAGFDWLGKRIYDLLPDAAKSWLEEYVSSRHKVNIGERVGSIFIPGVEEIAAYAVAVLTLTLSYSYVKSPTMMLIWESVPLILVTSIVFVFAKTYVGTVVSRRLGVWTEHRIWYVGLVLFAFSTVLLRVPFSSPSRLERYAPKRTVRLDGLLSSASIFVALVFAALFYLVYLLGFTVVGNIGVIMCLTSALFDSFPISPMGGKDVYNWRRSVWGILFAVSLGLFAAAIIYFGAM